MNVRELKGLQIADNQNIARHNGMWLVPSQAGAGLYKVNAEKQTCSCPDYDIRRAKCKHIFAVEVTIQRTHTATTKNGETTVTETVKVTHKQTYKQEWPAYNKAQTQEKRLFQYLLHQLCQGVGSPAQQGAGRRFLPLEDVIFAMAFKVYSTVSGRRFMSDLRDAHAKGYLSQVPSYNSMFDYFNTEMLTDHLQMLIEESSLPLAAIENDFAVDSSGFSTSRFGQWMSEKYGDPVKTDRRLWLKAHLICGVKTNVVASVEISKNYVGDSLFFKTLVDATAKNFTLKEVSADKAYLSQKNLQTVVDHNAMPYIAFKTNSVAEGKDKKKSQLWKNMYHYFAYNNDRFMSHYHKRSNVETTFHMIKAKFGTHLRSKTTRAQVNEALLKVLCHNICVLIQAMFELNLKPKFWSVAA